MGKIYKPKPAKLIVGMICKDIELFNRIKDILEKKFGKVDLESAIFPFDKTNYYEKEMGKNLLRKFLSFKNLIQPHKISKIKIFTMKIEERFFQNGKTERRINLDPGYLTLAKLVLPTTKDYYHRIYLKKGIFAEVTLYFKDGSFRYFDTTYPDYRTPDYINFFNQVRGIYLEQIRQSNHKSD